MRNKILAMTLAVFAILMLVSLSREARADQVWTVGSQLAQIAASGNNVYVLWQTNSPDQNVYLQRSTDGGYSFDRAIQMSGAAQGEYATGPHIALAGNNVYVAWMDRHAGEESKVLFRRSTDGGASFESPEILSNNAKGSSGIMQLFTSGDRLYAVMIDEWAENGTYYNDVKLRASNDDGKIFDDPTSLLPGLSQWNMRSVSSVAASGGMIYTTGVDYGNCSPQQPNCGDDAKIFFRRSVDGGRHFSDPVTISRPPGIVTKSSSEIRAQPPAWIQVAADDSHVSIVWGESLVAKDREAIFLARSSDGGQTFADAAQLDGDEKGGSDSPVIFSSNSTYVAWNSREDKNTLPHIAIVSVKNDGSFGKPVSATGRTGIPIWDAAALGKNVYVAWSNSTKNSPGLPDGTDVYFSASADGGNTFENPVDLSDDNPVKTLFATLKKPLSFGVPKIAASGMHVYVGWQASYPDSHELFFRASNDGGHTFGSMVSLGEETSAPLGSVSYWIYLVLGIAAIVTTSFYILLVKLHRRAQ